MLLLSHEFYYHLIMNDNPTVTWVYTFFIPLQCMCIQKNFLFWHEVLDQVKPCLIICCSRQKIPSLRNFSFWFKLNADVVFNNWQFIQKNCLFLINWRLCIIQNNFSWTITYRMNQFGVWVHIDHEVNGNSTVQYKSRCCRFDLNNFCVKSAGYIMMHMVCSQEEIWPR